ncbi:hypothetical protein [Alienimonas californiensis]|uniref:Uncharacterized protein n=1 Tax=Alienimonas californiensis TaxID=2527989 RepID=A0A517P865_9PLAN|nr:hypothetical protein [Alienimonas californiensis]QDT15571.1 hypothetical protein CA12_16560 [Alienimonas californiensis]
MPFDLLPTAFGLWLVAVGAVAALLHWRGRERTEEKAARGELEDWELDFHLARYRRRMQVAGLLVWLGVLIPAGDAALAAAGPAAQAWMPAYLAVLMTGVCGLLFLAGLDWFATAVHTRDRLADVQAKRVALEHALRALRAEAARAAEPSPVEPSRNEPGPPGVAPRNRLRDYSFDD